MALTPAGGALGRGTLWKAIKQGDAGPPLSFSLQLGGSNLGNLEEARQGLGSAAGAPCPPTPGFCAS